MATNYSNHITSNEDLPTTNKLNISIVGGGLVRLFEIFFKYNCNYQHFSVLVIVPFPMDHLG